MTMAKNNVVPRVLVVSRRILRKSKYVDYVGEFHLNLVIENGAVPVIVPRVPGILEMLDAFEPFHGLLLVEGEDVQPETYGGSYDTLSSEERVRVAEQYSGDVVVDPVKDALELELVRRCLERGAPLFGICRGSQIVNVACGGTLYLDVATEMKSTVIHNNPHNYDGHRHPIYLEPGTPIYKWFNQPELLVNSYHHCGSKSLGPNLKPMAYAADGLVEGFYDPIRYNPTKGRFLVGLQFHPERMQDLTTHINDGAPAFEHPGCKAPYQEFVQAVKAYCRTVNTPHADTVVKKLDRANSARGRNEKRRRHMRANVTVHGGNLALSLLRDSMDPYDFVDKEFWVSQEDITLQNGKVVVALQDPTEEPLAADDTQTAFDQEAMLQSPMVGS